MHLSRDIMVRLHEGELSPAEAFAEQEAREEGLIPKKHTPASPGWSIATALVTQSIITSPVGAALVEASAQHRIRLALRECYHDYCQAADAARNLATWGMKQTHQSYTANGRNVLFLENGLLGQRHGIYVDAGGYFADSDISTAREWERPPTPEERDALRHHIAREFGWTPEATHDPAGPIMVALQTPHDAPLQHYLDRGDTDGISYVINTAAANLPAAVPVLLRPHPRHAFTPADYQIPPHWTIDRSADPYATLRTCRSIVTANSTLGIEAMALGIPVAFLGRHVYTGSGAGLECNGHPDRLQDLPNWRPARDAATPLLCAILRHQLAYRSSVEDVTASAPFVTWANRCHGTHRQAPSASPYRAAAMRIRCRKDALAWDLLDATEAELGRCKPCSRSRHEARIVHTDQILHGGAPVLSDAMLEAMARAGLDVHRPDLDGYADRLREAQEAPCPRFEVPPQGFTLGFMYGGHLGDALCSTAISAGLQAKGTPLAVVRHRNTLAAFANHGIPFRNAGRIPIAPPPGVERGHLIQRLQRWVGLPEDRYPRPDIRLSAEELAWAQETTAGLPRPLVVINTSAISNADGYQSMAWPQWAIALADYGSVIQCRATPDEPSLPGTRLQLCLDARRWFALFSQASLYVGTWAAGIHVAAAFGLEAIVVTKPPVDPRTLSFPQPPTHIVAFLYPQHAYGIPRAR